MRSFPILGLALLLAVVLAAPLSAQEEAGEFWPKVLKGDRGEIVVYQPQIESMTGDRLSAIAAVSVLAAGQKDPVYGAMWFECRLQTDLETRMATLAAIEVTAARFPEAEQAKVDQLSRYLEQEIPTWDLELSIDRLVASLPDGERAAEQFKGDPPRIHYRKHPAVLVLIDGDPILTALEGVDLQYVANSAFFIVKDGRSGFFLRGSGMWFHSDDVGGSWKVTADLPAEVAKVSQKIEQEEAAQAKAQAEDAAALGAKADADEPAPEIIVSTVPAELFVTDGEADMAPITGTQLLYVRNTESDVLMDIAGQQYYLLISGRWYRAKSLEADSWQFVPFAELPADFAAIPGDSDMATVRASVPGTTEAQEALLETHVPQTAQVDRKTATCTVRFDGEPEFEVCGDNDVAYARNSDKPVLLIAKRYYCVDDAVWFEASGPGGPWQVSTEVPAAVQDIPPECPVYNVKYVYIYDSTPEVVYVGYTAGYYGAYGWGPCVVYGTGWYYPPWYGAYYYPRPVTFGFGMHYNPYTGWGCSFGISYGWISVGFAWGRPPYNCWGPGGYRAGYRAGYWHGYNHGYNDGHRPGHRPGGGGGHRPGYRPPQISHHDNAYRNRGDGVRSTGDVRPGGGNRKPTASDRSNNVYADRNGDVYRDNGGKWEKREGGDWKADGERPAQADRSAPEKADRSRDQAADRERAQQQQRDQQRERDQQVQRDRQRQQQLDRERTDRQRGAQRQQQAPSRGGGMRGGGGRRR